MGFSHRSPMATNSSSDDVKTPIFLFESSQSSGNKPGSCLSTKLFHAVGVLPRRRSKNERPAASRSERSLAECHTDSIFSCHQARSWGMQCRNSSYLAV